MFQWIYKAPTDNKYFEYFIWVNVVIKCMFFFMTHWKERFNHEMLNCFTCWCKENKFLCYFNGYISRLNVLLFCWENNIKKLLNVELFYGKTLKQFIGNYRNQLQEPTLLALRVQIPRQGRNPTAEGITPSSDPKPR